MNSVTNVDWKPLANRPIEEIEPNLWRVEGDLPRMTLKRVMTLVRRQDGSVVVHSAVALPEAEMKRIDAWGEVRTILVPNGFHRLDAPAFKRRYPKAKVLCPAGARAKVAQAVAVDGTYEDFPRDDASHLETLDGTGAQEGALVVRSPSGTTVVLNDIVFNIDHMPGFSGWVFRYITASSGGPRVSRVAAFFLTKDRAKLRAHLGRLAALPDLVRVIVSHGAVMDPAHGMAAREGLERAIATLA